MTTTSRRSAARRDTHDNQRAPVVALPGAVTLPPRVDGVPVLIPFSGQAKKALELTFRQALRLGHNYVGTEHIFLALYEAEDDDGTLHRLGADRDRFERELVEALESISKS